MSSWKRCKDFAYFAPRAVLAGLFMALLLVMALGNFDFFEPYLYPLHLAQGNVVCYGSGVTIGHYPQMHELERLKRERGVDLDISLLNDDLPQEKALNNQLSQGAKRLGIEVRSFPLSYLGLESQENKKRIAELAEFVRSQGARKMYIHCYLGRHRVAVVRDELVRRGLIPATGTPQREGL
ncbi:hypothetical protein LPW11_00935 [Geomonas sp. RF6]|uniref:hypothetical protein n=1 Tax=Geomonas sp. RF6 TaxID=2897342 RepID=UPI001E58994F|nr:hypothetical protein [Geomonas sp. RF6]UFS70769.1 hypothetical protein LPW11_00935 [Geomonas sp. RF6]